MYAAVSLAVLFALAVPAGDEKTPDPTGAPPTIQFVSAVDAAQGTVTFHRVETVKVAVQVTEIVNVGGQQVPVTKTVTRDEQRTVYLTQSLKNVLIQTASGLKLETANALKRIRPGMAVIVSADGKAVSPAFLGIVQPETIVLTPPAAPATPPMPRPLVLPKV
jgi:hypothetical protein